MSTVEYAVTLRQPDGQTASVPVVPADRVGKAGCPIYEHENRFGFYRDMWVEICDSGGPISWPEWGWPGHDGFALIDIERVGHKIVLRGGPFDGELHTVDTLIVTRTDDEGRVHKYAAAGTGEMDAEYPDRLVFGHVDENP